MLEAWKDRARLEGILMGLALGMLLAGRLSRSFKEDVKERNGIAEIRTEDWAVAWRFKISQGRLRIGRGAHPNPDYAMVYRDVSTAAGILMTGTEASFIQAISDGNLRFDGDLAFGMWFMELLQKLDSLIKQKRKFPLKRNTR